MTTNVNADTEAKVILGVLERDDSDPKKTETKIKRRLNYFGFGPYRQDRVDLLRTLKTLVVDEVRRMQKSRYFVAAKKNFDMPRMVCDFHAEFPELDVDDLNWFVGLCLFNGWWR